MAGRLVRKSEERVYGENDGQYLTMFVNAREKIFNFTCIQRSSLTSENSIIQWNPVCLLERGAYKSFAVLISTYDNDDCLQEILQECSSQSCVACIIVNPDEKSELLTTTIDLTQYNIPIYVVKKTDGRRIHELCLSERNVYVKTEEFLELRKQPNSRFSKLGKRLTRQTKLPDQLINYIGESWRSDISCEQAKDIFVQVILYLQKYDDEGRRNSYKYNMNDVITHLFSGQLFINFSVTLPVYVYLLAHIVSNEEVYICHDGNNAVDSVMQKCSELIKLKPQKVMETIAQYRPEKISGALKTRWKNVGYSFLDLLDHWTLTKPELPCDFFSKAIPMIVIAQTILKEAGGLKSELQKQWGTHLLKYADKVNYRCVTSAPNHIQWLEEGLQFQIIIRSTSDCYLMPKHLKELVNPGRRVCTLLEARNVLLTLPKQLEYEWKTNFLTDFIMPLHTSYRNVLKDTKYKDFRTVCTEGHWMGMITEGVGFIIAVEEFMKGSNCKESFTNTSFKWLKLVIKSIPFDQVRSARHTHCIDLLFSEEAVIKNHLEAIKQKLYVKFRESLKFLNSSQFLVIEKYTKSRQITDDSIFMDYFKNCEIIVEEDDLVCSKSNYRKVIEAWILRNPPGKRSDILVFFEMVSIFYEKCNRPSHLFLDLIQLNDLLTSSTDSSLVETDETAFHQFLRKKNKPNISNAILKDLSTFIVLPTRDTTNSFQWLVCRVILEGLRNINIINSLTLVKRILWDVKSQFELNTRILTADVNTPRIRFACGVLKLFASKVDFKKESWATDSPVRIHDLVTAIKPLFEKCRGLIVAPPPEIECCLSFFINVRAKCEDLGDRLRSGSISYNMLKTLCENNLSEIKSIVEVVKPRGNEKIDLQTLDTLHHRFLKIRRQLANLFLIHFKVGNTMYC